MVRLDRGTMARIQRMIVVDSESGCWLWTGPTTPNGYGKFRLPGASEQVIHRLLYEHYVGPIGEGLQLDHLCRVRACCRPEHFEQVTASENTWRQDHYERSRTECPKGHPYSDENTRIDKTGARHCRECDRLRKRR